MLRKLFSDPTDSTWIQLFRYVFVGGASWVADTGILTLLTELGGLDPVLASVAGFVAGLALNYLLSSLWVFQRKTKLGRLGEFCVFAAIGVTGLLINAGIIALFQNVLAKTAALGQWLPADKYYLAGKLVSTVVVFLWNFLMRKFLLYRKNAAPDEPESKQEASHGN